MPRVTGAARVFPVGAHDLYFRDAGDYDAHKLDAARGGKNFRYFFGRPESFPCMGIEETVEVGGGVFLVYLFDFAYPASRTGADLAGGGERGIIRRAASGILSLLHGAAFRLQRAVGHR